MVEVLASPTAGYLFLVRGEKSAVDQFAKVRAEAAQLKQEITRLRDDHATQLRAAGLAMEKVATKHEATAVIAEERQAHLATSRETEASLRERLVAYEHTLDLFRKEVGRARAVEIETDSASLAREAFAEIEARTSAAVLKYVAADLSSYMQNGGQAYTYTGGEVSIPEHVRELAGSIETRLGW